MKALILAAGRGERMRPLTDGCPKPLLPIAGKPLIVWHLEKCAAVGITDIVINVSYCAEQIKLALGNGQAHGVNIIYSDEPTPLESGGGLAQALPLLGNEAFALISADVFTDIDYRLLRQVKKGHAHWILVPKQDTLIGEYGLQNGKLTKPLSKQPSYSWSSMAVIEPALCTNMPSGQIYKLMPYLQQWIADQQVTAEVSTAMWENITSPQQYQNLVSTINQSIQ